MRSPLASHWTLDPKLVFLNHGSFGATPRVVLDEQAKLRARLEANPMQFYLRDLEGMLDSARAALANFIGASAEDLVFVPNATTGVNAVLRSMHFEPGDELLTTDHEYNACKNVLDFVAARARAHVVVAKIPFPLSSEDEVVTAITAKVTPKTRLLLVDHVTSPTGLVLPVARIAAAMAERGVEVVVDGAHAPGMVDLSLAKLSAHVAYYTANCHKWLCAPKGAAFLWVRRDKQPAVRPHAISHGANSQRTDRSKFLLEFDWVGTIDPTGALCIPASIDFLEKLAPDFRARNRALALEAQKILCDALHLPLPAPASMIGSLASVPLPDGHHPTTNPFIPEQLEEDLFHDHQIEVPIFVWPATPKRVLRVSAQLYNARAEYEFLARVLVEKL